MPEVDTSIYKSTAKPIDPMASMKDAVGIANAMNQNRLFGQTFEARKAIGDAYQQSIDPQTGKLDTNKLMALTSQNPRSAFMAGDVANQAQTREKQQIDIDQSRLNLAQAHVAAVDKNLGALIANPNLSLSHVTDAIVGGVADGRWTPQIATKFISEIAQATGGKTGAEATAAIKAQLNDYRMRNLSSAEQLGATNPTPQVVDVGGSKKIIQTPQVGPGGAPGTPTMLGEMPNTMSVPEKLARVDVVGPNNQRMSVPQAAIADQYGNPLPQQGAAQPNPLGTGRMNPPDAAPAEGTGAPAPVAGPPAGAPPGALQTGLAPGTEAAANVAASANAQAGMQLQNMAAGVPQQKALLGNLEAAISSDNGFTPGPGSAAWKDGLAAINRVAQVAGFKGFNPEAVASQEEFGKQAVQLAQAQFQALGGTGTDAKLESTSHTSPNDVLSKQGNLGIIHLLKGNADALQVMGNEWQKAQQSGMGPQDYGKFVTQFNKVYDPRVFQAQYQTPEEQRDMLKGMTKTEKVQFAAKFNTALKNGWVKPAGAEAGQ